jgi:hypothetical protein
MTVVTADSAAIACNLTSGDVISLAPEAVGKVGDTATMVVRTAKEGNCKAGSRILLAVETVQEFENEFNRQLDVGTEKMKNDPSASANLIQKP